MCVFQLVCVKVTQKRHSSEVIRLQVSTDRLHELHMLADNPFKEPSTRLMVC
jgi:hypothetical protein